MSRFGAERLTRAEFRDVHDLAFSPDGSQIIASGFRPSGNEREPRVSVFDAASGQRVKQWENAAGRVAFRPGSNKVAVTQGTQALLMDTGKDEEKKILTGGLDTEFGSRFAIDPSGDFLIGKTKSGLVEWDLQLGRPVAAVEGFMPYALHDPDRIGNADGTLAVCSTNTGTLQFNPQSRKEIDRLPIHFDRSKFNTYTVGMSRDGKSIVTVSQPTKSREDKESRLAVWPVRGQEPRKVVELPFKTDRCRISADGRLAVVTEENEDRLSLYDLTNGARLWVRECRSNWPKLCFSADGTELLVEFPDEIRLLDSVGECVNRIPFESSSCQSLAYASDLGHALVCPFGDRTIELWDIRNEELKSKITTEHVVTQVAFGRDRKVMFCGLEDGSVRVFAIDTGAELARLLMFEHDDWLVVTPDGLHDGSTSALERVLFETTAGTLVRHDQYEKELRYPNLLPSILAGERPVAESYSPDSYVRDSDFKEPLLASVGAQAASVVVGGDGPSEKSPDSVTSSEPPSVYTGSRYALLIGVSEYQHARMNDTQLEYPEADADAVGELLKESGYEVVKLLGASATRTAVDESLQRLKAQGTRDGVTLVGLFGHGVQYGDAAYFAPFDTTVREVRDSSDAVVRRRDGSPMMEPDPKSMIAMRSVLDALTICGSGNKVIVADCCREDPSTARGRAFGSKLSSVDLPPGTAALFSCSANEQAFEHSDWEHGAFTRAFLAECRRLSESGPVRANALAGPVHDHVNRLVRAKTKGRAKQTVNPIVNGVVDLQLVP